MRFVLSFGFGLIAACSWCACGGSGASLFGDQSDGAAGSAGSTGGDGQAGSAGQPSDAANDTTADGCTPKTCQDLNAECGQVPDGCENTISCGNCPDGQTCGGGGPNRCGTQQCQKTTCDAKNAKCGQISDGCSGVLQCGSCNSPDSCGGSGTPNQCGCTAKSCNDFGYNCGQASDGCYGTLQCGSCSNYDSCGGGGVANHCGCSPTTCVARGADCGSIGDGCGNTLTCGTCGSPATCAGGGTQNKCGVAVSTLVSTGGYPGVLALAANDVVFSDDNGYTIRAVAKTGGAARQLSAAYGNPTQIVVQSEIAYWSLFDGGIESVHVDGTLYKQIGTSQSNSYGIAVDSSNLYFNWSDLYDGARIMGQSLTSTQEDEYDLQYDDYWGQGISVYSGVLYYSYAVGNSATTGEIKSVHTSTPYNPTVLATSQPVSNQIVADSGGIYWLSVAATGEVLHMGLDGSNLTTLASGQPNPVGIATDSGWVYWACQGTGGSPGLIRRMSKTTPTVQTLVSAGQPLSIAVDNSGIYWIDASDETIKKIAK